MVVQRRSACSFLVVGQTKDRIRHPPFEPLVVHELFEQLGVILHHCRHYAGQRLVVLNAGVLFVGVLLAFL